MIPIQQTSTPVQLGQVLTALQADTRKNLQTLLREYSSAVEAEGADGYRRSIRYWEDAYRGSAIVQEATLGLREHDLSEYLDYASRVARGLDRRPERLKSLITDFNAAAGAFAREAGSLEAAIAELPVTLRAAQPALAELNDSLPPLRRFARDLRPSIRESGETIDVALPFLHQAPAAGLARRAARPGRRPAAHRAAARAADAAHPGAARAAAAGRPAARTRCCTPGRTTRCRTRTSRPAGPVYQEAPKPLPGLSGESRSGDANGPYVHVLASAGDRTVSLGDGQYAQALFPILGTNPPKPDGRPAAAAGCPLRDAGAARPAHARPAPASPRWRAGCRTTAAAQARYERAKATAVRWVQRELRLRGLDERWRVEGGR